MNNYNYKKTALLLIDIQKAFDNIDYWGTERNNPDAEENAAKLLHFWRINKFPLYHVQHCSVTPGSLLAPSNAGNEFKNIVKPVDGETIIRKSVNSAFINTDLHQKLQHEKIDTVVICGLTTDHCVSTTARMAANLGYKTIVVADATATFDKSGINDEKYSAETIHLTALAHLKGEFATICKTREITDRSKSLVGKINQEQATS